MASSRMRCSASPTFDSAPSAVCDSEMPSLALRAATFRPRTCAFMRSAIARPAASSLALLIRRPLDSRWMLVFRDACEEFRFRCVLSDGTLVLMMEGMDGLQSKTGFQPDRLPRRWNAPRLQLPEHLASG